MQATKQVKGHLVRHKGIGGGQNGDPDGAEDEDEALAIDICDAAPKEEEAAKGERVGRDDPLLAAVGDGEVAANGGEDDDNALDGEGLQKRERQYVVSRRREREQTLRKAAPVTVATRAMQRAWDRGSAGESSS